MEASMKCYLCNHDLILYLTKNNYIVYRCSSCGLGITDLKKDYHKFVSEHYGKGYFTGDPKLSAYIDYKDDKGNIVRNLEKFLKKVRQYMPSGKLLDVGCAMGYFVELANNAGYDAYGFDPSEFAAQEARRIVGERRIKIGTIDSVSYPKNSFDVITLFDVFEHLQNPLEDIKKLTTFLKPNGIIIIATGDTESWAAKAFGRRWTFYNPPQHLFFFNKANLVLLLSKSGLTPVYWFRIGKWLSLRYLLHLATTVGENPFAHSILLFSNRLKIEKTPLYVPLHDNMVVIAKKI